MKKDSSKISLLVIEDNRILREGIISLLKPYPDITIISCSGKSKNTILKIHELNPNVILLDLGLRSRNSLTVVESVKNEFPGSKIIVMDLVPVLSDIIQFVKAGASGFILKTSTVDEFLMTIRAVAEGVKVLPSPLNDSLFRQIIDYAIKGGKAKLNGNAIITKLEKEIFLLVSDGILNSKIAQNLHISEYDVKCHINSILEKLSLRTRIEPTKILPGTGMFKAISESISIIHN